MAIAQTISVYFYSNYQINLIPHWYFYKILNYFRNIQSNQTIESINPLKKIELLTQGSIGVFDSGYGGLTILKELVNQLPQYNFIYFGDNARSPYGNRSFDTVTHYTQQCVEALFNLNCNLVILACNTASAKALRSIQQNYLPVTHPQKRVLGVIRPTTEIIGNYTKTNHIGILGTSGTVDSKSYVIEIEKFFPSIKVFQQACPLWVPLVENNEFKNEGADYFIKKYLDALLQQSNKIDTLILGCTHYPLLIEKIKKYLPKSITILTQGDIVANSLKNYLSKHTEIDNLCEKKSNLQFYTSDDTETFNAMAGIFFGKELKSKHLEV